MASEPSLRDPELVDAARALATGARVLERALGDMTLPQFRVLKVVAWSPERASRIAELASVSRPSLSGVLDGLVARGWVARSVVHGDRRGVRLEVTPAGHDALCAASAAAATAVAQVLEHVPLHDRAAALAGLVLFARAVDERAARAAQGAGAL